MAISKLRLVLGCLCVLALVASVVILRRHEADRHLPPAAAQISLGAPSPVPQLGLSLEPQNSDLVHFPTIGAVKVTQRKKAATWKLPSGEVVSLPFTFQYAENGMWVRAYYRGKGEALPEREPARLAELYQRRGDIIGGIPQKNPVPNTMTRVLTHAQQQVDLLSASRIVLEHLLVDHQYGGPFEPVIIVKVWGVSPPLPDYPDQSLRMSLCYYLDTEFAVIDNSL